MAVLAITVRFHHGRYHGVPDWPPSPARLFQALVAGAAQGGEIAGNDAGALQWLEALEAPDIAAPIARRGSQRTSYVPNNDLDAKDGDPANVEQIRVGKQERPLLFDASIPLVYAWRIGDADRDTAVAVCRIAARLYQLGRGIDMAWASGEVLEDADAQARFEAHPDRRYAPGTGRGGETLACPQRGTLDSLRLRFEHQRRRFDTITAAAPTKRDPGRRKTVGRSFTTAPKARFREVVYASRPHRFLFEIRSEDARTFAPQPVTAAMALVEHLRDLAAARLHGEADHIARRGAASPWRADIDRIVIGRGATDRDKARRIRILPLPSIGHEHAEQSIRRIVIERPPDCPIPPDMLRWAFDGLPLQADAGTGEVAEASPLLIAGSDNKMAELHYGIGIDAVPRRHRVWETVTPAALPPKRRRIPPESVADEAKNGTERAREEAAAQQAVRHALRHAGIAAPVRTIAVRKEPPQRRGSRVEEFAAAPRFDKHALWHASIEFEHAVEGPVVIGDGRYLGLGLMAPMSGREPDVFVFDIGLGPALRPADRSLFLTAVRRALMAQDRDVGGDGNVSRLFSGHESDGRPSSDGAHGHVFLALSTENKALPRLYIVAPWRVDLRADRDLGDERRFSRVVSCLRTVRAGPLGVLELTPAIDAHVVDPMLQAHRQWVSMTPYQPTRHPKDKTSIEFELADDVRRECTRRGLPLPDVAVTNVERGPREGLRASIWLGFARAVRGPLLLGRDSHRSGGLFRPAGRSD